jgi:hypothetical protein
MLSIGDHKQLESFEMWCWRRIEKNSWTDRVGNEEVLLRMKNYFRRAILQFTAPCHSMLYNDIRNAWNYVVDYVKKRPSSSTRDFMEIFHLFFHLTFKNRASYI